MTKIKIECLKCSGRGEIKAYSGIAGGICFDCNGSGVLLRSASYKASQKYGADFGEGVVCWKSAKSEKAARIAFNGQFSQTEKYKDREFKIVLYPG